MTRVSFLAGATGPWSIERIEAIRGETLAQATALARVESEGEIVPAGRAVWTLSGVRSHERYLERAERERLARQQEDLGRPGSRRAALIPIHKRPTWWQLAQDERRELFEGRSRHIAIGSSYLPAIARRLYHSRDLGGPFDFLTWFEFADEDASAFDELVGRLRETEEWRYVDREVDVRLRR
jgi:chlorite dismutase